MGWNYNGNAHVTLANDPALNIPDGSWTFCGWFRVSGNAGSNYPRLFCWGTPGATPHIQVLLPQAGTGIANADRLTARVIDAAGQDTGAFYIAGQPITNHLNKWMAWCLTHDSGSNTTYLRLLDRPAMTYYTASQVRALGAITTANIAAPLYLGATSNLGGDRWVGDLADFAFIPGTFFDENTWHGYVHGGRAYRFPGCSWYVPMIGGRYEEWRDQLTVANTGTTGSVGHPQVQLITPKSYNILTVSKTFDQRVTRQGIEVLGLGDGNARVSRQVAEVLRSSATAEARVSRQVVEVLQNARPLRVGRVSLAVMADPPEAYLRISRVYAAALGGQENTPRVAQQFVEVLGEYSASPGPRIAQQFIEVLGTPPGYGIVEVASSDLLVLNDLAAAELGVKQATDTLELSDVASGGKVYTVAAFDSLSLSDSATCAFVYTGLASDTLLLSDVALTDMMKLVSDTLVLTDVAAVERINRISDDLALTEVVGLQGTYNRTLVDAIGLTDESDFDLAKRCRAIDNFAGITDAADFDIVKGVHDTLVLSDYATLDRVYSTSDSLTLTDEVAFQAVYNLRVSDLLSISDVAEEVIYKGIDALSITDTADAAWVVSKRATDSLNVAEVATGVRQKIGIASDTLSLTDSAFYAVNLGTDTLILSDEATAQTNRVGATSSLVNLSDVAECGKVYARGTGDVLNLQETAIVTAPRPVSAEDDLQQVYQEYDPVTGQFYDYYVGLQDSATAVVVRNAPVTATDVVSLGDRATGERVRADAIPGVAEDTLVLADTAWANETPAGVDALVLTETAIPILSKHFVDTLSLSDTAGYQISRVLAVSDTLVLAESVSWFNPFANVEHIYHPFVGGGSGRTTPPPGELAGVNLPVPGITDRFKLVYPPVGPFTDTLVLRAPMFGNRDRLQMNRISRETRGGTLIVFADPIWPKIQSLSVQFEGLCWEEASGLLDFMEAHLGQEIGLLDWEHRYWRGVIVNTTDPVVHDGKRGYTASFEFEGELSEYSP